MTSRKALTQIFILCRDRLEFAREAIRSAIEQDVSNIEVIVSDNSEHDTVGEMIKAEFPEVVYIRRYPALSSTSHFCKVLNESNADYIVLFHDDDILAPGYVRAMRAAFEVNPSVIAVGCNANILRNTTLTTNLFMGQSLSDDIFLTSVEEMLDSYLSFNKYRAAPFPGYMYRRAAIEGLYLNDNNGGKHADVTFLIDIIKRGHFLWLVQPLMQYRMHDANDSTMENVGHRLRLLRYIYKNSRLRPRSQAIEEFRYRYLLRWWRSAIKHNNANMHQWRISIIFNYLLRQTIIFAFTKPGFWKRIFSTWR